MRRDSSWRRKTTPLFIPFHILFVRITSIKTCMERHCRSNVSGWWPTEISQIKGITHGRVTNIQKTGEMLAGVFWWTTENRAKAVLHSAYFWGHALTAQGQCEWSAKGSKGSQLAVPSHLCTPGVGKPVPRRPAGPCWVAAPTETGYSPAVDTTGETKIQETLQKCGRSKWAFKAQTKSHTSPRRSPSHASPTIFAKSLNLVHISTFRYRKNSKPRTLIHLIKMTCIGTSSPTILQA